MGAELVLRSWYLGSGGGADGRTFSSSYKENSQRYIYFPKKNLEELSTMLLL